MSSMWKSMAARAQPPTTTKAMSGPRQGRDQPEVGASRKDHCEQSGGWGGHRGGEKQ